MVCFLRVVGECKSNHLCLDCISEFVRLSAWGRELERGLLLTDEKGFSCIFSVSNCKNNYSKCQIEVELPAQAYHAHVILNERKFTLLLQYYVQSCIIMVQRER